VAILEGIGTLGSISASAHNVGLTYRQVWGIVRELNGLFAVPLVIINRGGQTAGATLTPLGRAIVAEYRALEATANKSLVKHCRELERLTRQDPRAQPELPLWARLQDRTPKKKKGRISSSTLRR
jgi:molybdate transport system regulatory protein